MQLNKSPNLYQIHTTLSKAYNWQQRESATTSITVSLNSTPLSTSNILSIIDYYSIDKNS